MILAWAVWPLVVLLGIVVQALWRVLRQWYLPVLGAIAGFVGMLVAGVIMALAGPDNANDPKANVAQFAMSVRWWHRWQRFGVARLLSDDWVRQPVPPGGHPSWAQVHDSAYHVCFAASLTVGSLVLIVVFVWALVTVCKRSIWSFEGELRR